MMSDVLRALVALPLAARGAILGAVVSTLLAALPGAQAVLIASPSGWGRI